MFVRDSNTALHPSFPFFILQCALQALLTQLMDPLTVGATACLAEPAMQSVVLGIMATLL